MPENILVSSCLLGLSTRYDGSDNRDQAVIDYLAKNDLTSVPICPEQLAGLPTPRPRCWFTRGDGTAALAAAATLINELGEEVTATFLHGARLSGQIAQLAGCKRAILKQRSPSCGNGKIYLHGQLVNGMGVTAALLKQNGLNIISEEDLAVEQAEKYLHHSTNHVNNARSKLSGG